MCVAALAWGAHPRWRLVAIANRDEFHARAALPLARRDGIIAGHDAVGGGTWLGVKEAKGEATGRFALVVNVRNPAGPAPGLTSRGALVLDLLHGRPPEPPERYNPFTVIAVNGGTARLLTNRPEPLTRDLAPGILGLSNGLATERWSKTRALEGALTAWLDQGEGDAAPLFSALRRDQPLAGPGPDDAYSAVFVRDPVYGTRCSTVVLVDAAGRGTIIERSFDADGAVTGEVTVEFRWSSEILPTGGAVAARQG